MEIEQHITRGVSSVGWAVEKRLFVIEFQPLEQPGKALQIGVPTVQLQALIALLQELQAGEEEASGTSSRH